MPHVKFIIIILYIYIFYISMRIPDIPEKALLPIICSILILMSFCFCALLISGYFWIGVIITVGVIGYIVYQLYKGEFHRGGYGYDSTDSIFTESSL